MRECLPGKLDPWDRARPAFPPSENPPEEVEPGVTYRDVRRALARGGQAQDCQSAAGIWLGRGLLTTNGNRAAADGVIETDGRLAGAGSDFASSKAASMDDLRIRRTALRLELQDAPRWMWRYRRHLRQQLGFVAWGGEGRERLGNEHLRQAPVWRHLEPLKVARLTLAAEAPRSSDAEANRQRWLMQRDQNGTEPKPRRPPDPPNRRFVG